MGAPVCNINPRSQPPASRAPSLPSIPLASDLPSLIAAVNALRQLTIQYFNQVGPPGGGNTTFITNPTNPNNQPGISPSSFAEVTAARVTTITRIYDPNDPTQETYIDVKQITGLQFANKTGQVINWSQGS